METSVGKERYLTNPVQYSIFLLSNLVGSPIRLRSETSFGKVSDAVANRTVASPRNASAVGPPATNKTAFLRAASGRSRGTTFCKLYCCNVVTSQVPSLGSSSKDRIFSTSQPDPSSKDRTLPYDRRATYLSRLPSVHLWCRASRNDDNPPSPSCLLLSLEPLANQALPST